jgi:hypothetical protein
MESAGIKGEDLAAQMVWDDFWNQPSDDGDD